MSAPKARPSFCEPIYGWETSGPDTGELVGWLIDNLAGDVESWPDRLVEGEPGLPARLALLSHESGRSVAAGFSAGGARGEIRAEADASGWVRVTARTEGGAVFRAWLDRPFEEYHLWPDDAAFSVHDEPPGRMGKRRDWISLSAAAWPVLSPLAPQGWVTIGVAGR